MSLEAIWLCFREQHLQKGLREALQELTHRRLANLTRRQIVSALKSGQTCVLILRRGGRLKVVPIDGGCVGGGDVGNGRDISIGCAAYKGLCSEYCWSIIHRLCALIAYRILLKCAILESLRDSRGLERLRQRLVNLNLLWRG